MLQIKSTTEANRNLKAQAVCNRVDSSTIKNSETRLSIKSTQELLHGTYRLKTTLNK